MARARNVKRAAPETLPRLEPVRGGAASAEPAGARRPPDPAPPAPVRGRA